MQRTTAGSPQVAARVVAPPAPVQRRKLPTVSILRLLVAIAIFGGWELAAGPLIDPVFVSKPSKVAERIVEEFVGGKIFIHLQITLQEVIMGYAIGAVVGLAVGFITGRSQTFARTIEPFLMAFYSIPKIALAPLFIMWLGIGIWSKVAIVFLSVFFLMFYNTYSGVRNINEDLVNIARLMGASMRMVTTKVILPAATPYVLLGLKTSVPYAIIGAFVGEFIASNKGIGYFISYAGATFDAAGMFAGIFVLLAIVVVANSCLDAIEARLMRWKPVEEAHVAI